MSGISWAPMVGTSSGATFPVANGKNTRGQRPQASMGYSTQAIPRNAQYPPQSYIQNPNPEPAQPGQYGFLQRQRKSRSRKNKSKRSRSRKAKKN